MREVRLYITHINEFKKTRLDETKNRQVLFPEKINSIFGLEPVIEKLYNSVDSIENLLETLSQEGKLEKIILGVSNPYILLKTGEKTFLKDTPKLMQLLYDKKSFKKTYFYTENINFILHYLSENQYTFVFINPTNIREIFINEIGKKVIFVYQYCLSKMFLHELLPEKNSIVVNLHHWNDDSCISAEAYEFAKEMGVTLYTTRKFQHYLRQNGKS